MIIKSWSETALNRLFFELSVIKTVNWLTPTEIGSEVISLTHLLIYADLVEQKNNPLLLRVNTVPEKIFVS